MSEKPKAGAALRRPIRGWLVALAIAISAGFAPSVRADDTPAIAVAANLQTAMEEIAGAFEAESGLKLNLSFGSSGNISRQIRQGAPFELFFSADEVFVLDLARDGYARDEGKLYGTGRIVLAVPHGSPLKADGTLQDLSRALGEGQITRFAIANPEHAPYGRAAEQALRRAGIWDVIRPNLVYGENITQAALFATSGNAAGGIIAYSLALSPQVAALADYALIPEDWHAPLNQRMALMKGAGATAERFYAYVQSPPARAIFRKYGYVLPGESS